MFVPKDMPHRVLNVGKTTGTMLLTLEPAGLEVFFEELATHRTSGARQAGAGIQKIWAGVARAAPERLSLGRQERIGAKA